MSYRSGHYSEDPHHHPHNHGRPPARRPATNRASVATAHMQQGYTLVHAGKQVRFGPVAFWIVIGTVILLGLWSAATATYFAFRDDVLTRLIARQAEMQYAYEDRIAELRPRSIAPPAASCSTRNSSTRSSSRSCAARPRWNPAPPRWAPFPICRLPDRSGRRREERRRPMRRLRGRQNPRRSATPRFSLRLR